MSAKQFECAQDCAFADLSGPACESRAKALFAAVEKGYVEADDYNRGGRVAPNTFDGSKCPTETLRSLNTNISHALLNQAAATEGVVNA